MGFQRRDFLKKIGVGIGGASLPTSPSISSDDTIVDPFAQTVTGIECLRKRVPSLFQGRDEEVAKFITCCDRISDFDERSAIELPTPQEFCEAEEEFMNTIASLREVTAEHGEINISILATQDDNFATLGYLLGSDVISNESINDLEKHVDEWATFVANLMKATINFDFHNFRSVFFSDRRAQQIPKLIKRHRECKMQKFLLENPNILSRTHTRTPFGEKFPSLSDDLQSEVTAHEHGIQRLSAAMTPLSSIDIDIYFEKPKAYFYREGADFLAICLPIPLDKLDNQRFSDASSNGFASGATITRLNLALESLFEHTTVTLGFLLENESIYRAVPCETRFPTLMVLASKLNIDSLDEKSIERSCQEWRDIHNIADLMTPTSRRKLLQNDLASVLDLLIAIRR